MSKLTEKMPSISVIIPSFNQGQFVEETLLSVIGQGYPNLEIIVIDGGSTDNTAEILERYSNRITYWQSQKDNGQADAINQGMKHSTGEILCWLNSDDMYLPGTLLDVGRRFQESTDQPQLIYGSAISVIQDGKYLQSGTLNAEPYQPYKLTYYDFVQQPSSFWTRKLWQEVGELNTNYHYVLDWDWYIRASKITSFTHISKFYSLYRCHAFHKTSTGGEARRDEILDIAKRYASTYWKDIYETVYDKHCYISRRYRLLQKLKIPKRHLILPLFVPKLLPRLENPQDLFTALCMYGFQ